MGGNDNPWIRKMKHPFRLPEPSYDICTKTCGDYSGRGDAKDGELQQNCRNIRYNICGVIKPNCRIEEKAVKSSAIGSQHTEKNKRH